MMDDPDDPKKRLLFILIPLWLTFITQRTILHHSPPDTHVFVSGFLVHHLFWGLLFLIPTAYLLAMGIRSSWGKRLASVECQSRPRRAAESCSAKTSAPRCCGAWIS